MAKELEEKEPVSSDFDPVASRSEYLLDIAAQTFLQQGFEGTSVGEIARRAHASKETFYGKFKTKNELFRAVMTRQMDRFSRQLILSLATECAPQEALTAFADLFLERILSDEGVAMQKIVFMEARRFPEVAQIFFELGPQRTTAALVEYFSAQVRRGTLRTMDAELAAGHFLGLLTSDLMMRRSLGMLTMPSHEEKEHRVQSAVAVFLRAYGAS